MFGRASKEQSFHIPILNPCLVTTSLSNCVDSVELLRLYHYMHVHHLTLWIYIERSHDTALLMILTNQEPFVFWFR
jgi:hypothetical protein